MTTDVLSRLTLDKNDEQSSLPTVRQKLEIATAC